MKTCSALRCRVRTGLTLVQIDTSTMVGGSLALPQFLTIALCQKHFVFKEDVGIPVLPREGKAQELTKFDRELAQNVADRLLREPEEGCYMYSGIGNMCPESSNCPGCAQVRRWREKGKR